MMADLEGQARFVGKFLERHFPEPETGTVRTSAVDRDHRFRGGRITLAAHPIQPEPQCTGRIAHRRGRQQLRQILQKCWVLRRQPATADALAADSTGQAEGILQIFQTATNRASGDPGGSRRRRDPALARRFRLRRHSQTPTALVKRTTDGFKADAKARFVDHQPTRAAFSADRNPCKYNIRKMRRPVRQFLDVA